MTLLQFIQRVRKAHPPDGPPLVVHCSAGVGRTGTFIVLDTMLQRMKAEGNLNIYEFVSQLRTRRNLMIQSQVSECITFYIASYLISFTPNDSPSIYMFMMYWLSTSHVETHPSH